MKTELNANLLLSLAIFSALSFLAISFSVANGIFFSALDAFFHQSVSFLPSLFVVFSSHISDGLHPVIFFIVSVLTFFYFSWNKKYFSAILIFGGVSLSILSAILIKESMEVVRPESLISENGWSFPSIHTASASAFCFTLLFLFKRIKPYALNRAVFLLPAVLLVLAGGSRILSQAHWFSDVFGGIFLGLFWASFLAFILVILKIKDYA